MYLTNLSAVCACLSLVSVRPGSVLAACYWPGTACVSDFPRVPSPRPRPPRPPLMSNCNQKWVLLCDAGPCVTSISI